jgi:hypothetical protein
MKAPLFNTVLILTIACQVSAYVATYVYLRQGVVILEGAFYKLNSLTHFSLWVALGLYPLSEYNRWTPHISLMGVAFAANQAVDEFFCDPLKIQINEVALLGFVVAYSAYLYFYSKAKSHNRL